MDLVTQVAREEFLARDLTGQQLPRLHPNKRVVLERACPAGTSLGGTLGFSAWNVGGLPGTLDVAAARELARPVPGFFDYVPMGGPGAVNWHLNFADPSLFTAFETSLFAQDELQVAEHPALAYLRGTLRARGLPHRTIVDGRPVPILVSGVERRCAVDLEPDPAEGRPQGLYGNHFGAASPEAVRRAVQVLEPPTISNILALAAPDSGHGLYGQDELRQILLTAFGGYRAAALESAHLQPGAGTLIHTGFWGCGAFGGNRLVMTILQLGAAALAGVQLVFHHGAPQGRHSFDEARSLLHTLASQRPSLPTEEFLEWVTYQDFEWSQSDGT